MSITTIQLLDMSRYIYTYDDLIILYLIIKWIHGSFHEGMGVCNLRFLVIHEFKRFNAILKWILVDLSWDNVCPCLFCTNRLFVVCNNRLFVVCKGILKIQTKLGSCILIVHFKLSLLEIGVYARCGKRCTYIWYIFQNYSINLRSNQKIK